MPGLLRAGFVFAAVSVLAGCDVIDVGSTAVVEGETYSVGSADEFHLRTVPLEPYAPIASIGIGSDWLSDHTAYQIAGIDPHRLLVIKLRPDISGPNAPQSGFMVLLRGEDAIKLLCPWLPPAGPKPAVDCD
jgi:hypothetical protein